MRKRSRASAFDTPMISAMAVRERTARAQAKRRRTLAMAPQRLFGPRRGISAITPKRSSVMLTTCALITHSGAANVISTFKLNNAYNPFGTASANKPRGFDEMAALYRRCYVTEASVIVKGYNRDTVDACHSAVLLTAGATASDTSSYRIPELPYSGSQIALKSEYNVIRFQRSCVISKIYGAWDVGDFSKSTADATDPTKIVYARLYSSVADGSGTSNMVYHICIRQKIVFYDTHAVVAA